MGEKIHSLLVALVLFASCTTTFINTFPPKTEYFQRDWNIVKVSDENDKINVYKIEPDLLALSFSNLTYSTVDNSVFSDIEKSAIISTEDKIRIIEISKEIINEYEIKETTSLVIKEVIIFGKMSNTTSSTLTLFLPNTISSRTSIDPGIKTIFRLQMYTKSMEINKNEKYIIICEIMGVVEEMEIEDIKKLIENLDY